VTAAAAADVVVEVLVGALLLLAGVAVISVGDMLGGLEVVLTVVVVGIG
jgi:hypothetical protein